MNYKVVLTEQADSDLRGIYEYMAFILLEPVIATRQLERIEKSIFSLDEMPERFRAYEKEPWHSRGLCQMPVDRFIVFYIPDSEDKTVSIIRVLYGGRDIDEQLRETNS